jgi:hypothetical protein
MSGTGWVLYGGCALLALLGVLWLYRSREAPGRGRRVLVGVHWLLLALLLLLVFDPRIPTSTRVSRSPYVLLDASVSMALPSAPGGPSRWERAVAEAQRLAGTRQVILFGDAPRVVRADSLAGVTPDEGNSRLLPAIQAATEAGARRVIVLTDGGLEDAPEVGRWIPRLGVDLDYRLIGDTASNRALVEVTAPRWAEAGKPLEIQFGVAASGGGPDSIRVVVQSGAEVLASTAVAPPEPGRVATGVLRFTPAAAAPGGPVRYELRMEGQDAAPDDDQRTIYVTVSDEPTGVALLSLRPDFEPRFLQPVLQQALGLPLRGYLRTRDGEMVRTGTALEAGLLADEAEVRRALSAAQLVVIHGIEPGSPQWVLDAAGSARRILLMPATGGAPGLDLPFRIGRAIPDEWYPSADVPPSPIAPLLTGLDVTQAPPLASLMVLEPAQGTWTPMLASRGRRGALAPIAVAGQTGGRRWAVALGEGYWRWAFRGGPSRQLYARFWSALAGWLLQEQGAVNVAAVRPGEPVVPRGTPIRWVAPGLAPDSVRVRLVAANGSAVIDSTVSAAADTAITRGVTPGVYRYELAAFTGDSVAARGEGEVTAERYSGDYMRPAVTLAALRTAGAALDGSRTTQGAGRPLHALPWPYAALIVLAALLWIMRRRWGLR